MLKHFVPVVVACVFVGAPLRAQDAAPVPAPEKKICRNIVPPGSIMTKRFCMTKAEWKKFNDINDEGAVERFRNRPVMGCGRGGAMC